MPASISANGIRFAYLEEGTGPLVLLMHGFPDTAHTWDAVRPALAKAGYRAVSPFMRGYAPTELAPDGAYDSDSLGRDVLALISAFGEKHAIIVGHDWGASATYAAAALGPEKVELLVTIGIPHPASLKPTPKLLWAGRHFLMLRLPGAIARARANDFALIDELVQRWSPSWTVPKGETDRVKASFRERGSLEAALAYYRDVGFGLPASLKKRISVPTVAFAGEHDMVPVAAYERARRRFSGDYRVVAMPGSHFMHRQHPERFVTELLAVLASRAS